MKHCLHTVLLLAFGLTLSAAADGTFTNGEAVCFFGDSITHGGCFHRFIFDYYLTRFPDRTIRWWNAGVSGDSAGGAKKRMPEDVLARKPTSVVVMFGMNDVGRNNFVAEPSEKQVQWQRGALAAYRANMEWQVHHIQQGAHPRLMLCTPSPFDQTAFNASGNNFPHCNDGLGKMAEAVRELAGESHAEVVDFYAPMTELTLARQKINPRFSLVRGDRVHPAEPGHLMMAWLLLKEQKAPALVSSVTIDAAKGSCAEAKNATVEKVALQTNGISFSSLEGALPFPVQREAEPILDVIPFTQDLNQEILSVKGLANGLWTLQIDGKDVGKFDESAFAAGINLALLETPAMAQARGVAALTSQRDTAEKKLRGFAAARWILGIWGVNPDDMAAVKQYAATKMSKHGWYEEYAVPPYIAGWEKHGEIIKQVEDLERKAFESRHPVAHVFSIVR